MKISMCKTNKQTDFKQCVKMFITNKANWIAIETDLIFWKARH